MSILWVAVTVLQKDTYRAFSNNSCLLETAWAITDDAGGGVEKRSTRLRVSLLQSRRTRSIKLRERLESEQPDIYKEMAALAGEEAPRPPEHEMLALAQSRAVTKVLVDNALGCPVAHFFPTLDMFLKGAVCNMRSLRAYCNEPQPGRAQLPRAADQLERARADFVRLF